MKRLTRTEKLILREAQKIRRDLLEARKLEVRHDFREKALEDMKRLLTAMRKEAERYGETELENIDLVDVTEVYELLASGIFEEARRKISMLDTAVRDRIPDSVYDYLGYDLY